jgi:predicted restriction endonuclease
MTSDDRAVLDDFLRELGSVVVNKSPAGEARKKPLLVLLVISMLKHGTLRENKIRFTDVEERLSRLINDFGGRPTESGPKPEQPFYHLRTSPFWELTIPGGLPANNKKTLAKKVLAGPGAFASLRASLFALLQRNGAAREEAVNAILQRWWAPEERGRVRAALTL